MTCAKVTARLYALQIEEIWRDDIRTFDLPNYDPGEPDPWLALYLDQACRSREAKGACCSATGRGRGAGCFRSPGVRFFRSSSW